MRWRSKRKQNISKDRWVWWNHKTVGQNPSKGASKGDFDGNNDGNNDDAGQGTMNPGTERRQCPRTRLKKTVTGLLEGKRRYGMWPMQVG